MDELSRGPVDGFGAGERLIHHPSPGFVYKLVAIAHSDAPGSPMRPVAKTATGKSNLGGHKWAYREYDSDGFATAEHFVVADRPPAEPPPGEALQSQVVTNGEAAIAPTIEESRAFHARTKMRLPSSALSIQAGPPALVARLRRSRVSAEVAKP